MTVESSQKASSGEIPKLSEDLKTKERKLDDFENGDRGLNKLWSNLTEMNRKVSRVDPQKPGFASRLGCLAGLSRLLGLCSCRSLCWTLL